MFCFTADVPIARTQNFEYAYRQPTHFCEIVLRARPESHNTITPADAQGAVYGRMDGNISGTTPREILGIHWDRYKGYLRLKKYEITKERIIWIGMKGNTVEGAGVFHIIKTIYLG
ncbi:hypothetical protein WA026_015640 [Henosepilachna vigintioctopunctata]|uniref:Uncharacterized protein n=1 Tax=Henosepilachna vigintioctopunctata TaxID=420089 RepID=A0AAW1VDQ6_9CUCU